MLTKRGRVAQLHPTRLRSRQAAIYALADQVTLESRTASIIALESVGHVLEAALLKIRNPQFAISRVARELVVSQSVEI